MIIYLPISQARTRVSRQKTLRPWKKVPTFTQFASKLPPLLTKIIPRPKRFLLSSISVPKDDTSLILLNQRASTFCKKWPSQCCNQSLQVPFCTNSDQGSNCSTTSIHSMKLLSYFWWIFDTVNFSHFKVFVNFRINYRNIGKTGKTMWWVTA